MDSVRLHGRVFRTAAVPAAFCAWAVLAAPSARGELIHPRQTFLRNSVAGLFLHWGQRTSPAHTSCSAWEADVIGGGWNAN